MHHRTTLLAGLVAALAACAGEDPGPVTPESATARNSVPIEAVLPEEAPIPGRYIVGYVPGTTTGAAGAAAVGATPDYVYDVAIDGFAAALTQQQLATLQGDPDVDFIEPDREVAAAATQAGPPWGLDRIDQRDLPLDSAYTYFATGAGVRVYVVDSGLRTTHAEFGGRAASGYDAVDGGSADDCNGHGTHVAGTVGGATYGVAKGASLVAVRVLDCSGNGTASALVAGIDWVAANRVKPAVATLALAARGTSKAINKAVNRLHARGVTVVAAAGNGNADACGYSPAKAPRSITVGATNASDARTPTSNWGSCLDLFAPGSSTRSAWYTSNSATNLLAGTSVASAHVAGVAALYLQTKTTAEPDTVAAAILSTATAGRLGTNIGTGSPDLLVYSRPWPPVVVTMSCEPGGICEAQASGGTGSFSFAWTGATESFDGATRSFASPNCPGTSQVTVVATDDQTGLSASDASAAFCGTAP